MGPEAKLYQKVRKNSDGISWIRIENLSLLGTPDLLGYNTSGHFFTVELKVTKGNKIKFSPHQIAFHVKHPHNTFIMVQALGPRTSKLVHMFRGSRIMELAACGLKLDACSLGLEACIKYLKNLN
jgi:Holliday junction resolvase